MKKLFAMLLALCLTLSLAALAERADAGLIDPFAEDQPDAETTDEIPAQNGGTPDGMELYDYDGCSDPEIGAIILGDVFVDKVQAKDADQAEKPLAITAKGDNTLRGMRLYYHPYRQDITMDGTFQAELQVGGQAYPCRKYVETKVRGSVDYYHIAGKTADMMNIRNVGYVADEDPYLYLVGIENRSEDFSNERYRLDEEVYIMYDVFAMLPQAVATSGEPMYLVLTLGGQQYWYQLPA